MRGAVLCLLLALLTAGCSFLPKREIATESPRVYDERVRPLRLIAQAGITFSTPPLVFQETNQYEVGACKKTDAPQWGTRLYQLLALLEQNPQLLNRFHVIRFERGGLQPHVEMRGPSEARQLVLSYSKKRMLKVVDVGDEVPCPEMVSDLIGQTQTNMLLEWPTENQILELLMAAGPRKESRSEGVEALLWLADQRYLVNMVTSDGSPIVDPAFRQWSAYFGKEDPSRLKLEALQEGLQKILQKSAQAAQLGIFSLKTEAASGVVGIEVGGQTLFTADINRRLELTSPYIVANAGDFEKLNQCVKGVYKNGQFVSAKPGEVLSAKKNNYLFPGIHCP